MDARVTAVLNLQSQSDGSLVITATPARIHSRFSSDEAILELTFWVEDPGLIRGRFRHVATDQTAHFQGAEAPFRRLAAAVNLAAFTGKTSLLRRLPELDR